MKVKEITKYTYKNKEYNSLKEIKEEIQNTIGIEVLDKIVRVCPPLKHKDLFKLLDLLCKKEVRDILTECFNVEVEIEGDYEEETEIVNVLDI